MTFVRSRAVSCLVAISLSLAPSCSIAPSTHTNARTPVATSAEGEPIFQLSENELINVFRNVHVRHKDACPPVYERRRAMFATVSINYYECQILPINPRSTRDRQTNAFPPVSSNHPGFPVTVLPMCFRI